MKPISLKNGLPSWTHPDARQVGQKHAAGRRPRPCPGKALDVLAGHSMDFWFTTEDLSDPANRVTVGTEGNIRLHYRPRNTEAHEKLTERLKGLLEHIGCEEGLFSQTLYLGKKIPVVGVAHQCGTIRLGHDPKSSVLDVNCKAHDLDNLYVVDVGFFVSSTSVIPGLTIVANALRVGDHPLERLT